ncbi:MAG TPA: hypothetical protein VIR58_16430 [Acidimicrobiales bacterium]
MTERKLDADDVRTDFLELTRTAERFDSLAETAELMGDEHGAARLRAHGSACRERAMSLLDD